MRKYLIYTFCVLFCSCQNKQDKITQYLARDSEKYWTAVDHLPIKRDRRGFVLYSSGQKSDYWDNHDAIGRCIVPHTPDRWKLLNDTTLWFGTIDPNDENSLKYGEEYKIEYVNEDILILNNAFFKKIYVYKKSKDQKTKLKPRPPIEDRRFLPL